MRPFVSVIMNCYNSDRFLVEAIESVFAQTYDHWEIIFWDNASTDRSAEIAQRYAGKLKYFRADSTTPLGHARNLAMSRANGELIALLDCDDVWYPTRLERGVNAMADSKWAMCYAGVNEVDENRTLVRCTVPIHRSGWILPNLLNQFEVNIATILFRKSSLERHDLRFDTTFHASEEFNLLTRLAAVEPIAVLPEVLAEWRIHERSLTGKTMEKWADERIRTLDRIVADNPGIDTKYPEAFAEAYARGEYYRARYLVSVGDMKSARRVLCMVRGVGLKYRLLHLISRMPRPVWEFAHRTSIKRKIIPRILGLAK